MGIERIQHNKEALKESIRSLLIPLPEEKFSDAVEEAQRRIEEWKGTALLFTSTVNPSALDQNPTLEDNLNIAFAVGFKEAGYKQENGQDTYKYSMWREIQDRIFEENLLPFNEVKEIKNANGETTKILSLPTMRIITSYAAFETISDRLKEQQKERGWIANNPFLAGLRLLLVDGVAGARVKEDKVEVDFLIKKAGQEIWVPMSFLNGFPPLSITQNWI